MTKTKYAPETNRIGQHSTRKWDGTFFYPVGTDEVMERSGWKGREMMMSAKKESCFRDETSYYICIKYKQFFLGNKPINNV